MQSAFGNLVIGNQNQMRIRKKQVIIRISTSTGHVLGAKLNIIRTDFFRKPHPPLRARFPGGLKERKYSTEHPSPKARPSFTRGGELKKKKKRVAAAGAAAARLAE